MQTPFLEIVKKAESFRNWRLNEEDNKDEDVVP